MRVRARAHACGVHARRKISLLGDFCWKALIGMSTQPPLALLFSCVSLLVLVSEARRRLTLAEPRAHWKIRPPNSCSFTFTTNPFLKAKQMCFQGEIISSLS